MESSIPEAKADRILTPQLPHPQLEHWPLHLQVEQAQGDISGFCFVCFRGFVWLVVRRFKRMDLEIVFDEFVGM